MSVRASSRVWAASKRVGTELLMLLAIADFADDEGNAFPSVATLAKKCRTTPRHANRLLAELRNSGELEIRLNAGEHGQNRYRIVFAAMESTPQTPDTHVTPDSPVSPDLQVSPDLRAIPTPTSPTPDAGVPKPLTPTSVKPSLNRQEPLERAPTSPKHSKTRKPSKAAMPEDFCVSDEVKVWAAKKKFGRLDDHLEAFKLKVAANAYTYADWDAAFKTAIRDDWAKLRTTGTHMVSHGATVAGNPQYEETQARLAAEARRVIATREEVTQRRLEREAQKTERSAA